MSTIIYHITRIILSLFRRTMDFLWHQHAIGYCKTSHCQLGSNIRFKGRALLKFHKSSKITIGDSFICNSGFYHSIDNGICSKICVGPDAKLVIGNNSGISNSCILCHSKIVIGNYVNIGAGTMIFDSNFHSTDWKMREDRQKDILHSDKAPVFIGNHVFIGANSLICKGVTIGDKSMIAAGSVVICNIPEGEIWGGNPAKFIKKASTHKN